MNEIRSTGSHLSWVLVAAWVAPLAVACGGNGNPPPNAATSQTTVTQPPPGYAPPPAGYAQTPAPYPPSPGSLQPPAPYSQPPAGSSQPPTGYAQAPVLAPQPTYAVQPPAPGTGGGPAAPAPLAPFDPSTLQNILQGIQGALTGQLIAPGPVPVDVTEVGLKAVALKSAPGMQPEGEELKQPLTEGQHAVMMVTMQAGKCYTLLGFSPLGGVRDLELNLLAPPFYVTLAGQDMAPHSTPAIGAAPSPMCPILAFPLQYKLDIFARAGSGPVAVQLYSKVTRQ